MVFRVFSSKMSTLVIVFVLLFLARGLDGSPFYRKDVCGPAQCEGGSKMRYEVGNTYRYQYQSDISSSFQGTSTEESRLHLSATAELYFKTYCEGYLTLNRVSLQDSDPTNLNSKLNVENENIFREELERYSLRFSFHNGIIEEICPESDELTWVLNVKRGLLSSLVNSMKRLDMDHTGSEKDVNGVCEAEYKLERMESSKLIIHKKKNFESCTQRHGLISGAQGVPYKFPAGHQSFPLLNSHSDCKQIISQKVVEKSECTETHQLRPFSNGENGGVTVIRQVLELETFSYDYGQNWPDVVQIRSSILFDHEESKNLGHDSTDEAKKTLHQLCKITNDGAEMESAELFRELVGHLRQMNYDDLVDFYKASTSPCPGAKYLLLDAIPAIHTSASVLLMKDYIEAEAVPSDTAEAWMQSLAFFPRPDSSTIEAVVALLELASPPPHFLLSTSSLLYTYCLEKKQCTRDEQVIKFLSHLLEGIADDCAVHDKESKEKLLVTLKAIGNLGLSTPNVLESLEKCYQSEESAINVRVAAVEAYRRLPCGYNQDPLWELFRYELEDSELRIGAYLALMRCPNYFTILEIKDVLQHEEINQVGAFVSSHLKNLQETSMPSKAEIQGLVADEELKKKFKSDIRTFSRNFEASMFNDDLNIGGSVENNVIFSTNSFVPRSAMLNLTVDMFGQSINLLEMNLRAEGWEHYLESFFGPKGRFHQKTVHEILQSFRQKRAVPSRRKWSQINKSFNAAERFYSEPQMSISTKVFGNEIKFSNMNGLSEVAGAVESIDPIKTIQELVSGKEMSYQNSFLFLDSTLVVPTCVGFPLRLSALGTALLDIQMRGLAKSTAIFQKGELQIEGKIQPSAAVEVLGSMSVDATVANSGIKIKTLLHSSMAVEGNIDIQGTRLVCVEFGLPKNKLDIINVRSELLVSRGKEERKQEGITEGRTNQEMCSGDNLRNILGLQLCAKVLYPNATGDVPDFPLLGPTTFQLGLEKTDSGIHSFIFDYKQEQKKDRLVASVKIAAQGSSEDREISGKILFDHKSDDYSIAFQVPGTKVEAKGKFKSDDGDQSIDMTLIWNGKEMLGTQAALKQNVAGSTITYMPSASLTVSGVKELDVRGEVHVSFKKGISHYEVKMEIQASPFSAQLNGQIQKGEKLYSTHMKLEYQFQNKRKETINIDCKLSNQSSKSMVQMFSNMDIDFTQFPSWNFVGSWKYQRAEGHMENVIEINYSPEKKNDYYKLTLLQLFTYSANYEGLRFSAQLQATQPSSDMDYLLAVNHLALGNTLDSSVRFRFQPGKEVETVLSLKRTPGTMMSVEGSWTLTAPSMHPIKLSFDLQESEPAEFQGKVTGSWLNGENFHLAGSYVDKSIKPNLDIALNLHLDTDSTKSTIFVGKLSKDEADFQLVTQIKYKGTPYSLKIKYNFVSLEDFTFYTEFKKSHRVYSTNIKVNLIQQYLVEVDVHLDTRRDLYFKGWLKNSEAHRLLLAEIKWDANRDPRQKVALEITLDYPHKSRYKTDISVVFPGRTVKGMASGCADDGKVEGAFKLEWEPGKLIEADVIFGLLDEKSGADGVSITITTPLENWPKAYFIASLTTKNDFELKVDGGWQRDQQLSFVVAGNHVLTQGHFEASFSANFNSTINGWQEFTCNFHHDHHLNAIVTTLELQFGEDKKIDMKSDWIYRLESHFIDVSGKVEVVTPFSGYKNLQLNSHTRLDYNVKLESNVELGVNFNKYNMKVTGPPTFTKRGKWNVLINTPLVGYENIISSLSYNVAGVWKFVLDLAWPEYSLSAEGSIYYNSWTDFDGHFQLMSPYKNVKFVATLLESRVEMKGSVGEQTLGLLLSLHMIARDNMWLAAILETPLNELKKIGVELRCQFDEGAVVSIGAIFNDRKLGLRMESSVFRDEPLEWLGKFEVEPLIYPPLHALVTLQQEDNIIFANLSVAPFGPPIIVEDRFQLADLLNFNNMLKIHTPYIFLQDFQLKFQMQSDLQAEKYSFGVESRWSFDGAEWRDCGITIILCVPKEGTKDVKVTINVPLHILQGVNITFGVENDENYKVGMSIKTFDMIFAVSGEAKNTESLKEVAVVIDTPFEWLNSVRLEGNLDLRHPETHIKLLCGINIPDLKVFRLQGSWQLITNYFKASGEITSPFEGYETTRGHLEYSYNVVEQKRSISVQLIMTSGPPFTANLILEGKNARLSLQTPYDIVRTAEADLNYFAIGKEKYGATLTINLNQKVIRAEGEVELSNKIPKQIQGTVSTPFESMPLIEIQIGFPASETSLGTKSTIRWGKKEINVITDLEVNGPVWKSKLTLTTPFTNLEHINVNAKFQNLVREKFEFEVELQSPYRGFENVNLKGEYSVADPLYHLVKFTYNRPEETGEGEVKWCYIHGEVVDMKVTLLSWEIEAMEDDDFYEDLGEEEPIKEGFTLHVLYKNPRNDYSDFQAGLILSMPNPRVEVGANVSLSFVPDKVIDIELNLVQPIPNIEVHTVQVCLMRERGFEDFKSILRYVTQFSETKYYSYLKVQNDKGHLRTSSRIEWSANEQDKIENNLNLRYGRHEAALEYDLSTPFYQEKTLVLKGEYKKVLGRHRANMSVNHVFQTYTMSTDFLYKRFPTAEGVVNITTPYEILPEGQLHFKSNMDKKHYIGKYEFFWSEKEALIEIDNIAEMTKDVSEMKGRVYAQLPMEKAKTSILYYSYKGEVAKKTALFGIDFNGVQIMEANYAFNSSSSHDLEAENTFLQVHNHLWPFGINYEKQYHSGGHGRNSLPTTFSIIGELYHLQFKDTKRFEGEILVKTTATGKDMSFKGSTVNRTMQLLTDFNQIDNKLVHKAKMSWMEGSWLGYALIVDDNSNRERQQYDSKLTVTYPLRSMVLTSMYQREPGSLLADVDFNWDASSKEKHIGAVFHWNDQTSPRFALQRVMILVKHPKLQTDLKAMANYESNRKDIHGAKFVFDYSSDLRQQVIGTAKISWESAQNILKHWGKVQLQHNATSLNLELSDAGLFDERGIRVENRLRYNRGEEVNEDVELVALVDYGSAEGKIEWMPPSGKTVVNAKVLGRFPVYTLDMVKTFNGDFQNAAKLNADLEKPFVKLTISYDPELTEIMNIEGGMIDTRYITFNVWEEHNLTKLPRLAFHVRLNNTHLLTSRLGWNPTLCDDFHDQVDSFHEKLENFMSDTMLDYQDTVEDEVTEILDNIMNDMEITLQSFLEDLSDLWELEKDYKNLTEYLQNMYEENEFYSRDLYGFTVLVFEELELRYEEFYTKLIEKITTVLGDAGLMLEKVLLKIMEELGTAYKQIVALFEGNDSSKLYEEIEELLAQLLDSYSQAMKSLHRKLKLTWNYYTSLVCQFVHDKVLSWFEQWKPKILQLYNKIEVAVWQVAKYVADYLYETTDDLSKNKYYQKLKSMAEDIDELYQDLIMNDAATNIRKYYAVIIEFLQERYANFARYRSYLGDFGNFLAEKWEEFMAYPKVSEVAGYITASFYKITWIYNYLDITGKFKEVLVTLYVKGEQLFTQTAIEAVSRHTGQKTKFIFDPENGNVELEQKLPFRWYSFFEEPLYDELPEYQTFKNLRQSLRSSNTSFWDYYYQWKPIFDVESWIPPFKGHALLIGPTYFMTFDGILYKMKGTCAYVLASDFVDGNFTLAVKYTPQRGGAPEVILSIGKEVVTLDLASGAVRSKKSDLQLPSQLEGISIYQEKTVITIESPFGLSLECNTAFSVCHFSLSGWYHAKTGGLFGTLDHEASNDLWTPERAVELDHQKLALTWDVGDEPCSITPEEENFQPDHRIRYKCDKLYQSQSSELQPCFSIVDPEPFYQICLKSQDFRDKEACTSAVGYIEACRTKDIPLRIPSLCIKCNAGDGKEMVEGEFRQVEGRPGRPSSDVVFLVEAKDCNKDLKTRRKIQELVEMVNKELSEEKVIANRYAVVVFGGDGVYENPRATVVQNSVFASPQAIMSHFDQIPPGNGRSDIFEALLFASKLPFRPGVSRTFILLPCSNCSPQDMKVDYTVVHQALLENDITLHILMNGEFNFDKPRESKTFFGMDGSTGYTKRDAGKGRLTGDVDLRRQVRLPKSALGYCTPLALETNGTVFAGKKLEARKTLLKKFLTVFGRRIALTASPSPCHLCECAADNDGAAYFECHPCIYPRPAYIEYGYEEELSTSVMKQPKVVDSEEDYGDK